MWNQNLQPQFDNFGYQLIQTIHENSFILSGIQSAFIK